MKGSDDVKKILSLFLTLVLLFTVFSCVQPTKAASDKVLNIHAIYLKKPDGTGGEGDAVLVESDGHYLLMDAGMGYYPYVDNESTVKENDVSQCIMDYLDSIGVTSFDIYVSHIHNDHFGGIYNIVKSKKYDIGTIYVPAQTIANSAQDHGFVYRFVFPYIVDGEYMNRDENYDLVDYYDGINIVYLAPSTINCGDETVTDSFTFGSASVQIVGPVRLCTSTLLPDAKTDQLENNNSLCAVITSGNNKFVTMGDALEFEETDLANKYKGTSTLEADVFKEDHHGYAKTGNYATNIEEILAVIKPKYAFCQNKAVQSNVTVPRIVRRYGENCDIYAEGKTIVYNLITKADSTTTVKRTFCGHFFDDKEITVTKISTDMEKHTLKVFCPECKKTVTATEGHIWNSDGKCTVCGYQCSHTYVNDAGETKNNYSSVDQCCLNCRMHCKHEEWWATVDGHPGYEKCKTCYLLCNHAKLNSDGRCAECGKMCNGFVTEGENTYYYENGAAVKSVLKTIDGKKYYFASNGVMFKKRLASIDSKKYYFGADGAAYTSRLISVSGKKYYMGKDGVAYKSRLASVSGKKYYFGGDCAAVTSKLIWVDGKKYYMGKDGVAYKSKLISVSGKKYYIGKDCIAYKSKFASLSGKKYYFGSDCVMYTSKTFYVSGVKWRADSYGVCRKA